MTPSWLQTHIIRWAGFAMRLLHIYFGNLSIVADHIQRTMSQQRLKCKNISSGAQVGNSESVPEFMRVSFLHFCPGSQPINQNTQTILVEGPVGSADKEGGTRIVSIFTTCPITPDGFSGNLAHVNGTSLSTFCSTGDTMPDYYLSSFKVNVIDCQRTEFSSPQSRVQKGQDNRLIAVGTWPAHDKLFSLFCLRFSGINACLEYLFNIFFGECLKLMLLKFWSGDLNRRVGIFKLYVQPTKKGTECHPHITDGLGRQWFFTAIEAHRLILGTQPGHVTSQIGWLNFRPTPIPNKVQPMVERLRRR